MVNKQLDESTDCKNSSVIYHSISTSNIDSMLGVVSDVSAISSFLRILKLAVCGCVNTKNDFIYILGIK